MRRRCGAGRVVIPILGVVVIDTILRRLVEYKARRRAAQIIVFDGGAEIDRIRSFAKGAVTGTILSFGIMLVAAPNAPDAALLVEVKQREQLLRESNQRTEQAMAVADACLQTAERVQRSVNSYQQLLRAR